MATQTNSWSLLDPKKMQSLQALGMKALADGRVSLPEAQANATKLGLAPSPGPGEVQPNPLSMAQDGGGNALSMTSNPADVAAQMMESVPKDASGKPVRGFQASETTDNSNQYKRLTNTLFSKSPDQYRAERGRDQGIYYKVDGYNQATDSNGMPIYVDAKGNRVAPTAPGAVPLKDQNSPTFDFSQSETDQNDPYQKQLQGVDRMKDLLSMDVGARQGDPSFALAKLADAWSAKNPHLSDGMETPDQQNNRFMSYADKIQERLGDLNKQLPAAAQAQRGGSVMDQLLQAQMMKDMAGVNTTGNPRDPQYQADISRYRQAMNFIESKPQYQKDLAAAFTTNLELQLASSKNGPVSKEQFEELQNIVRRMPGAMLVSSGGGTTGEERSTMTMHDVAKDIGKFAGYFNSGVNALPADDKQAIHFRALAQGISAAYQDFYKKQLNSVAPGIKDVLDRNPELANSWADYIGGKAALADTAGKASAAAPAIQKGVKAKTTGAAAPKKAANPVKGFDPDAYLKGGS